MGITKLKDLRSKKFLCGIQLECRWGEQQKGLEQGYEPFAVALEQEIDYRPGKDTHFVTYFYLRKRNFLDIPVRREITEKVAANSCEAMMAG